MSQQVTVATLPLKKVLTALERTQENIPIPFLNKDRLAVYRDPQRNGFTDVEICSLMTDLYFQFPVLDTSLEDTLTSFFRHHLPYCTTVPLSQGDQGLLCPPNLPLFWELGGGSSVFDIFLPDPSNPQELITRENLSEVLSRTRLPSTIYFPSSVDGQVDFSSDPHRASSFWEKCLEEIDTLFPLLPEDLLQALRDGTMVRDLGGGQVVFAENESFSSMDSSQDSSQESSSVCSYSDGSEAEAMETGSLDSFDYDQ